MEFRVAMYHVWMLCPSTSSAISTTEMTLRSSSRDEDATATFSMGTSALYCALVEGPYLSIGDWLGERHCSFVMGSGRVCLMSQTTGSVT